MNDFSIYKKGVIGHVDSTEVGNNASPSVVQAPNQINDVVTNVKAIKVLSANPRRKGLSIENPDLTGNLAYNFDSPPSFLSAGVVGQGRLLPYSSMKDYESGTVPKGDLYIISDIALQRFMIEELT